MKKKSVLIGLALLAGVLTGCGSEEKEIYFLNFKPEVTDVYNEIVEAYEEETGVKVKIITAASGEYESTLKSEMAKKQQPAIFQINGPIGYESWKDYCLKHGFVDEKGEPSLEAYMSEMTQNMVNKAEGENFEEEHGLGSGR